MNRDKENSAGIGIEGENLETRREKNCVAERFCIGAVGEGYQYTR